MDPRILLVTACLLQLLSCSHGVQFANNQLVASPETLNSPAYQIQVSPNTSDSTQWLSPQYRKFVMRTPQGHSFHCFTPTSLYNQSTGMQGLENTLRPAISESTHRLLGLCHEYRLRGDYWSYEICHGSKIVQFHQDLSTLKRTQVHTLGIFLKNSSSTVGPVHLYDAGDSCRLPNGKSVPRSVVVQFKCNREYKSAPRDRLLAALRAAKPVVRVATLDEPKPCSYQMLVFTPLACSLEAQRGPPASTSPYTLLSSLHGSCVHLGAGWWAYELCFGKSLRQYHIENDQVVVQYLLGNFSSNQREELGRDQMSHQAFLVQSYDRGDECDLSGVARSTTVRFVCDPDDAQQAKLELVKETATCSYLAVVSTPLLCSHEKFRIKERENRTVHCVNVTDSSLST